MSKFCGFKSLWRTLWLWQNARPRSNWYMKDWNVQNNLVFIFHVIKFNSVEIINSTRTFFRPSRHQDLFHHYNCRNTFSGLDHSIQTLMSASYHCAIHHAIWKRKQEKWRRLVLFYCSLILSDMLRVHLYYSERESDVAYNLFHCFQSVYLYYSDSSSGKDQSKQSLSRSL